LQLAQRFTHRHVAHAIAGGQRIDGDARAELQIPGDDVIADAQADISRLLVDIRSIL